LVDVRNNEVYIYIERLMDLPLLHQSENKRQESLSSAKSHLIVCGQDIDGSVERTLNIHIAPLSQPSLSNCSNPSIADNCQGLKLCDLDIDWGPRGPDLTALESAFLEGERQGSRKYSKARVDKAD